MNNIKIFRANRGEGKTKWLVGQLKDCADMGCNCYYIGTTASFNQVKALYEATYYEHCPLKHSPDYESTRNNCFFTDEYFDSLIPIRVHLYAILEDNSPWYVTMSQENFVN